eukprot:TRINITY_DN4389_c1_g1_i3.p1 TRINITY_DN4389_c1_g1~~TRINITY_DN4389_c1_g1_i3.p1  ORF type:complete len:378 (+),score=63.00 TRINITY_DN4389_c1_g1_i3:49-1134(+)
MSQSKIPFLVPQPQFQIQQQQQQLFNLNQIAKLPIPQQPVTPPRVKRARKTKTLNGALASLFGVVCVVVVFGFFNQNFVLQSGNYNGLIPNRNSNFNTGRGLKYLHEFENSSQSTISENLGEKLALPQNSNDSNFQQKIDQNKVLALPKNSNSHDKQQQFILDQNQILASPKDSNLNSKNYQRQKQVLALPKNPSQNSSLGNASILVPVSSNEEAEENVLGWLDLVGQDLMLQSKESQIGFEDFWVGINQAGYDAPISCKEVIQFDATDSISKMPPVVPIISFKKQSQQQFQQQILSHGREKYGSDSGFDQEEMVSLFLPVHQGTLKGDKIVAINKVYVVIVRSGELYVAFECELQQQIFV